MSLVAYHTRTTRVSSERLATIKSDRFVDEVLSAMNWRGMALFAHPDRDNISDEAEVSAQMIKYDGRPVRRQVEYYKSRGYPDNGLWAAGILARDNRNRRIRKLGRRWMGENVKWTYQDQISLPYLLWKLRIAPGTIPYNLWDNPLFDLEPHASEL